MSFVEKEIEDEGNHYHWLLVASSIPKNHERRTLINYSSNPVISDQVDKDKLVQYFVVIQEIMQRFAVFWHKVANDENNGDFHTHFHETKVLNKLVILKINIIIILLNSFC